MALIWVELRRFQPVDGSSITSKYNNTETGISYIELSWARRLVKNEFMGAFLWGDLDQDQLSKITRIMVHQRNQ